MKERNFYKNTKMAKKKITNKMKKKETWIKLCVCECV